MTLDMGSAGIVGGSFMLDWFALHDEGAVSPARHNLYRQSGDSQFQ